MITKEDVLRLAQVHEEDCISIYIPTHRAGQATQQGEDAIRLKNELKGVREKLEQRGWKPRDIQARLAKAEDLVDNASFWNDQSDGLALFISPTKVEIYQVPVHFAAFHYISSDFYIRPLLPFFTGDGLYYLLTLTPKGVRFFEATRHTLTRVEIQDLVPGQLEETVGFDHEDKGLQFRSQQGNRGKGMYHGQGDEVDQKKEELRQYFKEIDEGLNRWLKEDEKHPMVLVCLDEHAPVYRAVNSYAHLYPKIVSGNPDAMDELLIHEKSWNLMAPYFDQERKEKMDQYGQHLTDGKASSNLEEIFQAAMEGRIDTLFLENLNDLYGTYDPANNKVQVLDKATPAASSLTNELAKMTFSKGGSVYLLERDELPDASNQVNAIFRFSHED
jgi:hypothetical protein